MEMDNYQRGLRGHDRDINQNYHDYAKGKNIREMTSGSDANIAGGAAGGGMVFFALAIIVVIVIFPYAVIALLSNLFVHKSLKKKYPLTYWSTYIPTLFSTLVFNIYLVFIIIFCAESMLFSRLWHLGPYLLPIVFLSIGLFFAVRTTAKVFYRTIGKRIKSEDSIRYSIFLIIPINIFGQLLPLSILLFYILHQLNIPFADLFDIKKW